MQTAREIFQFGVFDDETSYILAEVYTGGDKYHGWNLNLRIRKLAGGEVSEFAAGLASLGCNVCGSDRRFPNFAAMVEQPIIAQLVKEGRSLYARAQLSHPEAEWVETEKVSTLRLKGDLIVHLAEYEDTNGETFSMVDLIKIETTQ